MAKGKELRVLTALVVAAMVVSFAGTVYVVQQLKTGPSAGFAAITGAQVSNATTSVSVGGNNVSFFINPAVIDFETLFRTETNQTDSSGATAPVPINVTNNGSVLLNFTINFSEELFDDGEDFSDISAFAYNCSSLGEDTCTGVSGIIDGGPKETQTILSGNVSPSAAVDTFELHISVSVPSNESSTQKTSIITVDAFQI